MDESEGVTNLRVVEGVAYLLGPLASIAAPDPHLEGGRGAPGLAELRACLVRLLPGEGETTHNDTEVGGQRWPVSVQVRSPDKL